MRFLILVESDERTDQDFQDGLALDLLSPKNELS